VLSQLLAAGQQVRALVPIRIQLGYLHTLNWCRETSLFPRLSIGIDTVFLVWVAPADAITPVLERIAKCARRVVLLSAQDPSPLFTGGVLSTPGLLVAPAFSE
jgi:hypothetical protein